MSKKCDVKWFVSCCRTKALQTIVKKAEEDFIDKAIRLGVFNEFITTLDEGAFRLNALQKYISSNIEKAPQNYTRTDVFELITRSYWGYGMPDGSSYKQKIFADFYKSLESPDTKCLVKYVIENNSNKALYDLIIEYTAKFEAVSTEYGKLQEEIKPMTPAQSVKFLGTLGFDISKLKERAQIKEEPDKFDKSLIFVCGDNQ